MSASSAGQFAQLPGPPGSTGPYGLNLPGWGASSVWGLDPQWGCLYAQLWRDGEDATEPPTEWIMPPRWPEAQNVVELAYQIAEATGVSEDTAAYAIAQSFGPDVTG